MQAFSPDDRVEFQEKVDPKMVADPALEGDAKDMYKHYLSIPDKSDVLDSVWQGLELAYGYREIDSMTKIYKHCNGPVVNLSVGGM